MPENNGQEIPSFTFLCTCFRERASNLNVQERDLFSLMHQVYTSQYENSTRDLVNRQDFTEDRYTH